ncbi:hypothetical protein D9619_003486 [Psilocybe cf. subviscida]|uniref:F-box domain-containing protein n=1 Tax=Psilocybe cf. subviscida TaxID=2480587 RepID=A0A8H5AWZ6_9AGAR|nr:hypothetical protein D9619_003486 [Psilocybe cf. subviscida]
MASITLDTDPKENRGDGIPRIRGPALVRVYTKTKSISDLPDDVLTEIFLILYAYWPSEHKKRSELGVCRRWYNVMISMPLLWTCIHVPRNDAADGEPQHRLNIISFSRSRSALLDVQFSRTRNLEERDCSLVFRNASRIRRLEACFVTRKAFHDIFNGDWEKLQMPNLQSLIIYHCALPYGFEYEDESDDLRPLIIRPWQGMEALRNLQLDNFYFAKFPPGTGVRSLSINSNRVGSFMLKKIFEHFPYLETLSIYDFEIPNADEGEHLGPPISAPHLRNLAIGSFCPHNKKCNCGLELLVAPNIEIVEYHGTRRSLLNKAHTAILVKSGGEKARRLRVCNQQRSNERDLLFYSTLSSHIDVEFAELPGDNAGFIVELLSSLGNLHSLTLALYPCVDNFDREQVYQDNMLNPTNFSEIIRQFKPVLACPTYIRVFDASLIAEDVKDILGQNLTILVSPPVNRDWFCYCGHIIYTLHDWDEHDRYWRDLGPFSGDDDDFEDEYWDEDGDEYFGEDDDEIENFDNQI